MSVNVDGQAVLGHAFNGLAVDGDFGLLTIEGVTSFDDFTIRTNDPAQQQPESLMGSVAPTLPLKADQALTDEALARVIDAAKDHWTGVETLDNVTLAYLEQVTFEIADLPGQTLGSTLTLDINAAGLGWFVDPDGTLGVNEVDLLTVVAHEIGHWLGFEHDEADGESPTLMSATLAAGAHVLTFGAVDSESTLPDGGTVYLPSVVEQAIPMPEQLLISQPTMAVAVAVASQATDELLDARFVPVVAKPAPEELRVFDPATGELLTYEAEARTAADDGKSAAAMDTSEVAGSTPAAADGNGTGARAGNRTRRRFVDRCGGERCRGAGRDPDRG